VSGSPTSIGDSLPALDTGPSETQVISPPADTPAPTSTGEPAALPAVTDDTSSSYDSSGYGTGAVDSGTATTADSTSAVTAPVTETPSADVVQQAAPISQAPMVLVDTASIYLILVAGAAVALLGGTVLRLVGVKLKWTS
jgi:hypothetical protein